MITILDRDALCKRRFNGIELSDFVQSSPLLWPPSDPSLLAVVVLGWSGNFSDVDFVRASFYKEKMAVHRRSSMTPRPCKNEAG